jgi:uncharacterized membrane protein YeaQ/YmgE (transglycosylase-associated protein family)
MWTTSRACSIASSARNAADCGIAEALPRKDQAELQESEVEDAQGLFGNPGVGFLSMLLIGAVAGWIAERVTASDHNIFTNILVGIAGAFVGGILAHVLNIPVFGFFRTLVAATIGAVLILFVWHRMQKRT